MFGFGHFADAFSPGLWQFMLVYALCIVVMGQLTWFQAVSKLPCETVSTWGTIVPGLAFFFAWLLLGDIPTPIQWTSLVIVIVGLLVAKFQMPGVASRKAPRPDSDTSNFPTHPITGA